MYLYKPHKWRTDLRRKTASAPIYLVSKFLDIGRCHRVDIQFALGFRQLTNASARAGQHWNRSPTNANVRRVIEISHAPIDIAQREDERDTGDLRDDNETETIYLNEVEEEWDLSKYRGIGWDEQE